MARRMVLGSRTRARADDDFERHVQFFAVTEFFNRGEAFLLGLSHFFMRELFDQRAEEGDDFAELLPIFFDRRCPTAGDNAVFLMDITEASPSQRAPETIALAEHEEAGAIGIVSGARWEGLA